ncbi:MAG: sigma-54-dependent Fis family transcriptional regulator [Candidatus Schekmanbacteria bacterium]|nr:sigma-54-dependent Fis family transcriptional regulator [Candidatus Schekmanbacteria bacterium]
MTLELDERQQAADSRHLAVLRRLLRRDYLTSTNWDSALLDLARMAKEALEATETLTAIFDQGTLAWVATTGDGKSLRDEEISLFGSRRVLEQVRDDGKPLLTTSDMPLLLTSESLASHEIVSVLAAPLWWWDMTGSASQRVFGGCLYAHRSSDSTPFGDRDVDLLLDLAELAQRTFNLLRTIRNVSKRLESSQAQLDAVREAALGRYRLGTYETRDPDFAKNVIEPLHRISHAYKINLLITGPTGSGKSHIAQAYHYQSPRRQGPFVTLDCAQITSAETLAAELFGYAPQSGYANAPARGRPGKAELAHEGTLFVDEIGCLPLELQQRLLRLIQTGSFSRLGDAAEQQVDVQVIGATNADLKELISQGRFREDLYFRISVMRVHLPALDKRIADIPELAGNLLRQVCAEQKIAAKRFTASGLRSLMAHAWARDGNIRGLQHAILRSVLLASEDVEELGPEHLSFESDASSSTPPSDVPLPAAGPHVLGATGASGAAPAALPSLLRRKILEHRGNLSAMAADRELVDFLGYLDRTAVPLSTLNLRIREHSLQGLIASTRERAAASVAELKAAIRTHRSAHAAAESLGITRHALFWRLRREGLTMGQILAEEQD